MFLFAYQAFAGFRKDCESRVIIRKNEDNEIYSIGHDV